jgi:hypothetical protein
LEENFAADLNGAMSASANETWRTTKGVTVEAVRRPNYTRDALRKTTLMGRKLSDITPLCYAIYTEGLSTVRST